MIRNLVFDFGGVVVDINWDNAVARFKEIGLKDADIVLDRYKQQGIFLELEEGKIGKNTFSEKLSEMCGRKLSNEELEYAWLGFFNEISLPRLRMLEELHRKYKMCLLSNTNPYVMDWARSDKFSDLGKGLDFYFDKLYMSYMIGVTKPSADIFEYMIKDSGLDPEETLFVDDGLSNIETARSLGFDTLHVTEGNDWTDSIAMLLKSSH